MDSWRTAILIAILFTSTELKIFWYLCFSPNIILLIFTIFWANGHFIKFLNMTETYEQSSLEHIDYSRPKVYCIRNIAINFRCYVAACRYLSQYAKDLWNISTKWRKWQMGKAVILESVLEKHMSIGTKVFLRCMIWPFIKVVAIQWKMH